MARQLRDNRSPGAPAWACGLEICVTKQFPSSPVLSGGGGLNLVATRRRRLETTVLRKTLFASMLASSALALAVTPAVAGKSDRAREAIAAADAKLQTAEGLGAATDSPRETAQARALLASAREDFKTDHREQAIQEAIQAQALADTAIGLAQKHKDQALASARDGERATAEAARATLPTARW